MGDGSNEGRERECNLHVVYSSDEEDYISNISSEKDEACALSLTKHLVPKLTGRRRKKSEAKWISEGSFVGMAEVVTFKGNYLKSTGIVRNSRVLLHVEEIGYLMEREALIVFHGDSVMTIMDIYTCIMSGDYGCTWEAFKVYLELKNLGFIISRHNVLWSNTSINSKSPEISLRKLNDGLSSHFESLQLRDGRCMHHAKYYAEARPRSSLDSCTFCYGVLVHEDKSTYQHHDPANCSDFPAKTIELMFDVFPPNSSFKKTNPGTPDFCLYISGDFPPDCASMEDLKAQNDAIPVTIATVDSGRVSFFHFNEVQLPVLP